MTTARTHPEIANIDGTIYDIENGLLHDEVEYSLDADVLLPALRYQAHNPGEMQRLHALLSRIVDPATSDDVAYELWHQDADMNRFRSVDGTRRFAGRLLRIMAENPDVMTFTASE